MNRLLSILLVCLLQITLAVASTYQLTVEVTPEGSGSLNTSGGTYEEGSKIYLYAYNNTGFVFKGWYEGEKLLSSSTSFNYKMPANNVLVQARFEYNPEVPDNPAMPDTAVYYQLTTAISPLGAGSINVQKGSYVAGEKVYLYPYLNNGFKFSHWQDERGVSVSKEATFYYPMPKNDSQLTAICVYDPKVPENPDSMAVRYSLDVKCKPEGSGSFNVSNEQKLEGETVYLYSYTNTGFEFLHWEDSEGNILSTEANLNYVMPGKNTQLYGVFEYNPKVPSNPRRNSWNIETGEVIVDDFSPGYLGSAISEAIEGSDPASVYLITVAGRMSDNDFGIVNGYSGCTLLDLSRVSGVTRIPSYAFDRTSLEAVYLPVTIEKIDYQAFAYCKQLSALTCYAMVPPVLEDDVFRDIPEGLVVYVPAVAISKYQKAEVWKDFTLLPIQEDVRSLTVDLPEGTDVSLFNQMWLELTNTKNGQKIHYIMTDRMSYVFSSIIHNTSWNVVLRNQKGDVFGSIDNVEVKDEDVTVSFTNLSTPKSVHLTVLDGEGKDVTAQVKVTWMDSLGHYLSEGANLKGLAKGTPLRYTIDLPENLSLLYQYPLLAEYKVDTVNQIVSQLVGLSTVNFSGRIVNLSTKDPLRNSVVCASQQFANKYSRTRTLKTNAQGEFSVTLPKVSTTMIASAPDFISQSVACDSLMADSVDVNLGDIALKPISGAVVSVGFTFTESRLEGEKETIHDGYSDFYNVSYAIYNQTAAKPIEKFNVQYPDIVLLEEVNEGDVLELTAISKTHVFNAVKSKVTIQNQKGTVVFDVVEQGRIASMFKTTKNSSVVGILYDEQGKLVHSMDYIDAKFVTAGLPDGSYSLVTMGTSRLLNTIFDLSQYTETGLIAGQDYLLNHLSVKSGVITSVSLDTVPYLDESKFYYTGNHTSFMVNKPNIVVGNFLTFSGRVDFKKDYVDGVKNVQLIVDLPESCSFVENSVMVGNASGSYSLDKNRIVIPMHYFTDRVRFCVIPTLGGHYAPSAFVQFDLGGETIMQPIGSANYQAKDLSIGVSALVAKTTIPVHGTAQGHSSVDIYDNGMLIGQTMSRGDGQWSAKCELFQPKNLSHHAIYAKVKTKKGLNLISETVDCVYDKNAIEVDNVTMINVAHPAGSLNLCEYVSRFDFQDPAEFMEPYWYWPSYPDFTFLTEFTSNDSSRIFDVRVEVMLSDGKSVLLPAKFDSKLKKWVTQSKFQSVALPTNVGVHYYCLPNDFSDNSLLSQYYKNEVCDSLQGYRREIKDGYAMKLNDREGITFASVINTKMLSDSVKSYQQRLAQQGFEKMETFGGVSYYQNENSYAVEAIGADSSEFFIFYNPEDKNNYDEWVSGAFVAYEIPTARNILERARDSQIQGWIDMAMRKLECADMETEIKLEDAVRRLRNSVTFLNASFFASLVSVTNSASRPSGTSAEKAFSYGWTLGDMPGTVSGFAPGVDGLNRSAQYAIQVIREAPECDGDHNGNEEYYPGEGPGHVMDPSGYVYEAVSSNRLQGVTATCYYKEMVEDMYGDLHENIVKWNAEEYAQKNPLFTDEYGMYAWDVPQGLWQVRFEKAGYENTQSEWLPVPPPQLEVNIAMTQNKQPEVKMAKAFEAAVELEFDKYMLPEDMTTENISVLIDDQPMPGKLTLLNEERVGGDNPSTFVSKVRFDATEPFSATEVTLLVNNRVRSYAGIRMQEHFTQTFSIEPEVQKIVCDSAILVGYGLSNDLRVTVLPAIAAAGKVLRVSNSSRMVLGVTVDSLTLDSTGQATIPVTGELPGTSALTFTIDGYDLNAVVVVNVEQMATEIVATPTASVVSGSEVEPGTEIYLSCETEGAIIYYTLDGTCPCEPSASVKTYDGNPIVVNETVEIKAMAVVDGMIESEVATFIFTVIPTSIEENVVPLADVYPRVVKQRINIDIPSGQKAEVLIASISGYTVYHEQQVMGHQVINMTGLKSGLYVVAVKDKDRKFVVKVIKVHE